MKRLSKTEEQARKLLDATAVNPESWPFDIWSRSIISGRIVPERCSVDISARRLATMSSSGKSVILFQVESSHIFIELHSENDELSLFEISDIVRQSLFPFVDYMSFNVRGFYEVVLDTCLGSDGILRAMPIYEPIFEPPREGYLFIPNTSGRIEGLQIPLSVVNREAAQALHDLSQAFRSPARTLEYCRMAIESIRSHFDPKHARGTVKSRQIVGEKVMCQQLKISRDSIVALESFAAPGRHSMPNSYSNWPIRKEAAELSWEVLYRFILHLEGENSGNWQEI